MPDVSQRGPQRGLQQGTVERWCLRFIEARDLETKLAPPAAPDGGDHGRWESAAVPRLLERPGRPEGLRITTRAARTPGLRALVRAEARARLVHTFLHHELQAAELFAWAILAFPGSPRTFRAGLLRLCGEELAHLALYRAHLRGLGFAYGDFPVRDWFWQRVGSCTDAASFVALLGLGLEGANLDHSARFAAGFRAAGDEDGARILERVEREEIAHVAFAVKWFPRLSAGPLDYTRWRSALPEPLTPAVLRGRPLNRAARRRAGQDEDFLDALEAEPSATLGRRP